MSEPSGLSSRDYEREAAAARQRLAQHLDELSDRLTPAQVLDEMLTYARGGGTLFHAIAQAVREHPVPAAVIGAGCVLLVAEKIGFNGHRSVNRGPAYPGGAIPDPGRRAAGLLALPESEDSVRRRAPRLASQARAFIYQQPLLCAAIAVALGAAAAAALPASEAKHDGLGGDPAPHDPQL
jgi:hypothetical protein